MKWSILTPSIPERYESLKRLSDKIQSQIGDNTEIEHLVFIDNKRRLLGLKRDALLKMAQGEYISFVDDDDDISDDYVAKIYEVIMTNPPDVITFDQHTVLKDGKINGEFKVSFGLQNDNDQLKSTFEAGTIKFGDLNRKPFHVCVWKSEHAKQVDFPDASYGEDWYWAERVLKLVNTEVHIDSILHYYVFDKDVTAAAKIYPKEKDAN
jgi:glycosyltransferase involved in cell wall biosynthesis